MVSNHFLPTHNTWLPPLLALLLSCLIVSDASSKESVQNLTDQWVEQAAGPLIKDRTVDGMSIGYLEGKHYGVVHLGSVNRTKQKATHTTLYEVGSISKVFTSLLLADAVVRGEIDLQAAAATENAAGIQFLLTRGRPSPRQISERIAPACHGCPITLVPPARVGCRPIARGSHFPCRLHKKRLILSKRLR